MFDTVKRTGFTSFMLALMLVCVCPLRAAETEPAAPTKTATPGVELAKTLTTVTGVAISPLMGVGAVGVWQYYHATPQQRAHLPWFAHPWFWIPALTIVSLCALKDIFGVSIPPVLKKPFDIMETVEHKVSGLVAIGAFVPLIVSVFHSAGTPPPAGLDTAFAGHGFLAAINGAWLGNLLFVPLMMVVFFVVTLASNAINVLILLSPFPLLDALLKLFRLTVLAGLTLVAFINPWLGALFALVIIAIAWVIAGWSFRLTNLGVVFVWEILPQRSRRFSPETTGNAMFIGRKALGLPSRTYGRFIRDTSGNLVFQHRPWLVLSERTVKLPAGTYVVGKGLFYSEILRVDGSQTRSVMLLPPRYRSHEEELAHIYGFGPVRHTGLRAAFAWLKDWLGFKARPQAQIVAA